MISLQHPSADTLHTFDCFLEHCHECPQPGYTTIEDLLSDAECLLDKECCPKSASRFRPRLRGSGTQIKFCAQKKQYTAAYLFALYVWTLEGLVISSRILDTSCQTIQRAEQFPVMNRCLHTWYLYSLGGFCRCSWTH